MIGEPKRFRTKRGYCHILHDRIILCREQYITDPDRYPESNGIALWLVIYSLITIYFFYDAYDLYQKGKIVSPVFSLIIAGSTLLGLIGSFQNSTTPVVFRDRITDVKCRKGLKFITRARFEIWFINKNGNKKRRLIMLPGALSGGEEEVQKALRLMREEEIYGG